MHKASAPAPSGGIEAELLDVVGHDLRDPLAAMLMGTSFLLKSLPDRPENARARKMIVAMLRSGERMSALVKNLLDFVKIERNELVLSRREHELGEIVDAVARRISPVAAQKGVPLTLRVEPGPHVVTCDPERVADAFTQLVANAVRYSPAGREVLLEAKVEGDTTLFTVADHGAGMSAERRAHLFEPYWHMRQSPRDGTGLGLAIARGIAELHGGVLRCDATGPEGSSFTLAIPAK